jgi:hypothetical protein
MKFRCITSRALSEKTEAQLMADLPKDRLQLSTPAFYACSVDLFGPMKVKFSKNKTIKTWGVLFTCMNTRAVYVDLAQDYSTDGFLMTLRRFMSVRGCPSVIYIDRGGNLIGAKCELRNLMRNLITEGYRRFVTIRA